MHDDAGVVERCDGAIAQIPSALRRAAGEDHDVAGREPRIDEARQHNLVVGADAERLCRAARLLDRGGKDRGVRIIDHPGLDRLARRHDLVAGRNDRDARPPPDLDCCNADRGQHANLARCQHLPGPQHGLTARQVAAGERNELPGRRRATDFNARASGRFAGLGMLDHHDRISAARHHAAGGDQRCRTRHRGDFGCLAGGQDFAVKREDLRRTRAGAGRIGGAHGKPVDIRAVEARYIDIGVN